MVACEAIFLLLCLVGPVFHCDHPREDGADCCFVVVVFSMVCDVYNIFLPVVVCLFFLFVSLIGYRIQPNYCTVRLGFSKMLGKLVVKYVPTYTKGVLKKIKKTTKDLSNNAYAMFLNVFFFFFFFFCFCFFFFFFVFFFFFFCFVLFVVVVLFFCFFRFSL